jgi:DNA-binding response OmpR family regulator
MKSILIVDDEPELRGLLVQHLGTLGYEVAEAESGKAALKAIESKQFDLFILDLAMPKMTGDQLLREMRGRGITAPAIFLTAHNRLEDKTASFEAGGDDFLTKPFSPRELEFRIEALLRRSP